MPRKVFDINGGSKVNSANLQLYDFNNSSAQKFQITFNKFNKPKSFYTFKCLCSDKFLTFNQSNNNIIQFTENNNSNQKLHI